MKKNHAFTLLLTLLGVFLAGWLAIRYLLPVALPFLLGLGMAALAEPLVRRLADQCRLPRALASTLVLTGLYLAVGGLLYLLCRTLYRELGAAAQGLPALLQALAGPLNGLQQWLDALAGRAPEGLRPWLEEAASGLFSGTAALTSRITGWLLGLASSLLTGLPDSMLMTGTAILSSFMISAQLPCLRRKAAAFSSARWQGKVISALLGLRRALSGWCVAQLKLMLMTFLIVTAGLFLLRVEVPLLAGGIIALVDALPMLGTGTVLLPWGLLLFLQGRPATGAGLIVLYGISAMVRSALEPRMVGRQLGIDPLLTLTALYAGYRLWGVGGMLLAPVLTITALQLHALFRTAQAGPPASEG